MAGYRGYGHLGAEWFFLRRQWNLPGGQEVGAEEDEEGEEEEQEGR